MGSYSSNGHSGASSDEGGGLRAVCLVGSDDLGDNRNAGASRGESARSESDDGSSSETHVD